MAVATMRAPLLLPTPPSAYDQLTETRRNEALKIADLNNYKKDQNISIPLGRGIILQSPDGGWWLVTVSNSGVLSTESRDHP